MAAKRIMITGVNGQLGHRLLPHLFTKYGSENILATDLDDKLNNSELVKKRQEIIYKKLDVTDKDKIEYFINDFKVATVIHLPGVLSALSEEDPELAKSVNVDSVHYMFRLALKYKLKVFIPSGIAVYGSDCQKENVPIDAVRNPTGLFGVTKLFMENLGHYYRSTYNLDFRCLRLHPIISPYQEKLHFATSDFAYSLFKKAEIKEDCTLYLNKNRKLALTYIDDAVDSIINLLEAPQENLTKTTYNYNSCVVTPEEFVIEMEAFYPKLKVFYKPDVRDVYVQSWPLSFDDSHAKKDWNFTYKYKSVPQIVRKMYNAIQHEKTI